MPTKKAKRVTKLRRPANPEAVLLKLYPTIEDDDSNYVDVEDQLISVNGNSVSRFGSLTIEMPGCCGVSIIQGLDSIAPKKKEAYAAVHALYVKNESFGTGAATLATTNNEDDEQLAAAAFFRANGWKEIPLSRNPNSGNQLTLWILKRN